MTTKSLNPPRITNLDFIRGVALLGILMINSVVFGLPLSALSNPSSAGHDGMIDWTIVIISDLFFNQKMMGLFSLLFGAGIVLFLESARNSQHARPRLLSFRRNFLLLVFGLIHISFIWKGDVLTLYAICAPIIIILCNRGLWKLISLSALCMLLPVVLSFFMQSMFDSQGNLIDALRDPDASKTWNLGLGKFWFKEAEKAGDLVSLFFIVDGFLRALGMMLLGVVLYRLNVIQGTLDPKTYRRMAIFGLLIGLPITLGGTLWMISENYSPGLAYLGGIPNKLGIVPLVLAYVGILSLLDKRISNEISSRIRACGRMAFTNYLLQSILGVLFFTVLFEHRDFARKEIVIFVVAVWAIQLLYSKIWLDNFRFGPMEWFWRKLTYKSIF